MSLIAHTVSKLQRDGVLATVRAAAKWIRRRFRRDPPSDFDVATGLDTDGLVSSWQVKLVDRSSVPGVRYQPTPAASARQMLMALPIEHSAYHFVDLGCGKGRVLVIAAEFGFKSVVGVEYAMELAQVARRNIEKSGVGGDVRVLCQDASSYVIPDDCVVFMYNPFGPQVMTKVAASIERARNVYVVYFEPDRECALLLDAVAPRVRTEREIVFYHRA